MKINEYIDHTYLKPVGTNSQIDVLLEEAKTFKFKSVCVQPAFVDYCKRHLEGTGVLVCTVIGFPLGQNTIQTKVFETLDAIHNGADEIDMVINIGKVKSGDYEYVINEVNEIAKACKGHCLKVIIETCYLEDEEIVRLCQELAKTEATFIKTSTGFGTAGATDHHVKLMKDNSGKKEIKAAGGVRTIVDFEKMVAAGATRIGTSNGVSLMKNETGSDY